jgi:nicotinamidase/pyrazinamidase
MQTCSHLTICPTDAIIDIDVQTAFMPGGGLAVLGGDEILPAIKRNAALFSRDRRYASVDRHRKGSVSLFSTYRHRQPFTQITYEEFLEGRVELSGIARVTPDEVREYLQNVGYQVLWTEHALDGTAEGELHPELSSGDYAFVLIKGMDDPCDSYSAFRDNRKRSTGLGDRLRAVGVKRVFLEGLAFDFCVGYSALDARAEGFEVVVLEDATRSVNLNGSAESMRAQLQEAGVRIASSSDLRIAA